MRDAHRMKEKFDVSLDNRQIVSLLIAGIVVLGAVFVLGVVVGKKLAGDAQTANSPDLLSALDANAEALQEVQTTFQDELTRKAATEPAAVAAPKPATAKAPAPAEKPAAPKPEETAPAKATAERPTLAPTPDPDTGELPPEEPEEEAVAAAEPPAPAPEKPAPAAEKPATVVAKAEQVSGKVEVAAVPTRTTEKAGGTLKEAMARVAQPPAKAVTGGAFTLQISAFQDKGEAERFAAMLRGKGYAPYIVPAEVPGKGTWYRVRMGSFKTREDASRYQQDFKREMKLDAFVATN